MRLEYKFKLGKDNYKFCNNQKFTYNHSNWTIRIIDMLDYKKENSKMEDNAVGYCDYSKRSVIISKDILDDHQDYVVKTFLHELTHVTLEACAQDDDVDQEIVCETTPALAMYILPQFRCTKA